MSVEKSNLDSLFEAAIAIESADQRAAFLSDKCGDDLELREQLEQLLESDRDAGGFLEKPHAELEGMASHESAEQNRAASLGAGLASAFSLNKAVVVGGASHSVLRSLDQTVDVPGVALRESAAEGADPIARPRSPEIPQTESDSRYRFDGEIARGGMGAIIKGRDMDLGRDLAIKVLLDTHKDKPEVIQRFVEEAQIGGQLQHPGIAPVYELGQFSDQRPFFSMKLVKGDTLSKLLADREGATEDRGRFIGIFEHICQTMAYAHSRGVIHRDLKPANIMVGAFGEVQVMDWGLAKVLPTGGVADEKNSRQKSRGQSIIQTLRSGVGSDAPAAVGSVGSETQMGSVMGTPAYMPPEQALGEIDNMDERADVFGLGAVLSEILTGDPPYIGDDGTQIFRLASRGKLDACFKRLNDCGADPELITLAKHCLAIEPVDRPRDAGELADRVTGYLESVETKLRETELQRAAEAARVKEERKRRKVQLALAASVLLLFGLVSGGWLYMERQTSNRQAAEAAAQRKHATEMELLAEARDIQRLKAEAARTQALSAKTKAEDARNDAVDAQQALRKESYLADMHLAQQALDDGTIDRVHQLLKKHIPLPDETDLRNIEWYQLWGASHLESKRAHSSGGPFGYLAASPDRKWVAVRRWKFAIDIFDAETMNLVRTLSTDSSSPFKQSVAFSPDGRWLAAIATAGSNAVQLWRTDDWTQAAVLPHEGQLNAISFSPDGTLATVDQNGRISFWNGQTWKRDGPPVEGKLGISSLAFSPDGTLLVAGIHRAAGGGEQAAHVWDVGNRSLKASLAGRQREVSTVAWSSGNVIATGSSDGSVQLWDGGSFAQTETLHTAGSVIMIAFSDDGQKLLATTSRTNAVHVWETASSRLLRAIKGHSRYVHGAAFVNDDKEIWSSSADFTVKAWDWTRCEPSIRLENKLVGRDDGSYSHGKLAFSRDDRLVTAFRDTKRLSHWRPAIGAAATQQSDPRTGPSSALSDDGKFLVEITRDEAGPPILRMWEATNPEPKLIQQHILPLEVPWPVRTMAVSGDGSRVVWSRGLFGGKQIALHDTVSGSTRTWRAEIHDNIADLALSADGSLMALRTEWHTQVWDAAEELPVLKHSFSGYGPVHDMQFSPDGTLLAAALWNNNVRIYDPVNGIVRCTLRGNAGPVNCLDFSDDGRLLVTGDTGGTIRVWDVAGQFLRMALPAHGRPVRMVAFSHDGLSIVSAGADREVRLWRRPAELELDNDPDFQEMKFSHYNSHGLWHETSELLSQWLKQTPDDASLLRRRARVQTYLERHDEAVADFTSAFQVSTASGKSDLLSEFEPLLKWRPLDSPVQQGSAWRYVLEQPLGDWMAKRFDDSNWRSGGPRFQSEMSREGWPNDEIWLRKEFTIPDDLIKPLLFLVRADDEVTIHVNGVKAGSAVWTDNFRYQLVDCSEAAAATLKPGPNVVAVHCRNTQESGCVHVLLGTRHSNGAFAKMALQAVEAVPEGPEKTRQLADLNMTFSRWDAAADSYAELLDTLPKKRGWNSERSRLLQQICGNEAMFEALRKRLPDANELWLAQGRRLALMSRWKEANAAYAKYDHQPDRDDEIWLE